MFVALNRYAISHVVFFLRNVMTDILESGSSSKQSFIKQSLLKDSGYTKSDTVFVRNRTST